MRFNGKIKWFSTQKGYGFIVPDDGGKDVFLHARALQDSGLGTLNQGDDVSFMMDEDNQGRVCAGNVKRVE